MDNEESQGYSTDAMLPLKVITVLRYDVQNEADVQNWI